MLWHLCIVIQRYLLKVSMLTIHPSTKLLSEPLAAWKTVLTSTWLRLAVIRLMYPPPYISFMNFNLRKKNILRLHWMVSVNNKHNVNFGFSKTIKMRNTVLQVLSCPVSETKGICLKMSSQCNCSLITSCIHMEPNMLLITRLNGQSE